MKDEMFDELMESVKQAVAIRRGEIEPGRVTSYPLPEAKVITVDTGIKKDEFFSPDAQDKT